MIKNIKRIFIYLTILLSFVSCNTTQIVEFDSTTVVIYKDIYDYSSEGGYIQAVLLNDDIKYLHVKIFGETYRSNFNYSFNENNVIISIVRENYTQPFYIEPEAVLIKSIEREMYLLENDKLYEIVNASGVMNELSDEKRNEIVDLMNSFVDEVFNGR
ncbi:MAG: hypothetical protein FWD48_07205 [Oscillospiraceae bacterium]|nr:hypothetical protein [Oscillospiraceae bacterium]